MLERAQDYRNWDKLIRNCDVIDGLTDIEKERAKRAFLFLKSEFGEDFLEYAFDNGHPIISYIPNLAPWTRKWITRFAEALRSLREEKGYASLLKRLKDKDKFVEGESVLDVAYKFFKAGFKTVFDPSTLGNRKVPDLELISEEKELFVEVSVQLPSMTQVRAMTTMNKTIDPLWHSLPFLNYAGRLYKALSEKHLAEIQRKVRETVDRAKTENAFQELISEDTLELGLAPDKDKGFLEKWAKSRGLKIGEFSGPSFEVNELQRTRMKIQKEQKQLPSTHPNILVVRNNNLFFGLRDIRKGISDLEECLYEFPHLLFVIVTGGYLGSPASETIMKDQHVFVKRSREDFHVETHMILLNRYCAFDVSPATISKVYVAFGKY